MTKSCCAGPIAKIIRVGAFDAGIVGLGSALDTVFASGVSDEEAIKAELLRLVKQLGNYVSPGTESDYKEALLREYRTFAERAKREASRSRK